MTEADLTDMMGELMAAEIRRLWRERDLWRQHCYDCSDSLYFYMYGKARGEQFEDYGDLVKERDRLRALLEAAKCEYSPCDTTDSQWLDYCPLQGVVDRLRAALEEICRPGVWLTHEAVEMEHDRCWHIARKALHPDTE